MPKTTSRLYRFCPPLAALSLIAAFSLVAAWGDNSGPLNVRRATRDQASHNHNARIRVDVELVLVPVTVLDPLGRVVTGLEQENFKIFDGKRQQKIISFNSQDAPVSVGLVFDLSGSMSDKFAKARAAATAFFRTMNPQDEAFLITFSDRPDLRVGFTSDFSKITSAMLFEKTKGRTALIDSVFLGLHENMRHARNSQRALVVISDGGDNSSRYTLGEMKRLAWEADTQIYAIGIHDHPRTLEEINGIFLLKDIAERSGGRHFVVRNIGQLADVTAKIGIELHNQYLIGYYPPKELPSGKYRRIRVKLKAPKGLPPLSVYARTGYYVPGG